MATAIASRRRPSRRAWCNATRSQTSSAITVTPCLPVRRSSPQTAIAVAWNTVRAVLSWTDGNTVTSIGPVASSSDTKMIRWPLRTAGVCEAILTPATITHVPWRLRWRSLARVTPRSRSSGSEKLTRWRVASIPNTSSSARTTSTSV